ncbi:MAG TPA: GPW/gp25 family protein [Trinickia sp.]|uniref:GPW/gp25 family protein n=1 Tax=Trinickia sp. TaxID=2571163 RepID=UPI002D0AEA13|nr:GPW/gp25 family protein [Trinickia sp.]HVW51142.1 GPW/gp25 family protein [Trinickia sp.]
MLANSDFLGRGWSFPIALSTSARVQWSAGEQKIRESILAILRTVPGERVLMPTFGCRIGELVFAPNNSDTRSLAQTYVTVALQTWEPRINAPSVTVGIDPKTPTLLPITIEYIVRETNKAGNLVYPFYLK